MSMFEMRNQPGEYFLVNHQQYNFQLDVNTMRPRYYQPIATSPMEMTVGKLNNLLTMRFPQTPCTDSMMALGSSVMIFVNVSL